jgi:serine/threonine-protein phosphatase 2A regulatory subunit B''
VVELTFFTLYLQMSDWDRYAAEEYELLVAEEGANDNQDEV